MLHSGAELAEWGAELAEWGSEMITSPTTPQVHISPWSLRSSEGCNNALIVLWMGAIGLFTQAWKKGYGPGVVTKPAVEKGKEKGQKIVSHFSNELYIPFGVSLGMSDLNHMLPKQPL